MTEDKIGPYTSLFKFSQITSGDWNCGAAMFTLENMGALSRKFDRGEKEVILNFIAHVATAYLREHDIEPPEANWTPPVEQETGYKP